MNADRMEVVSHVPSLGMLYVRFGDRSAWFSRGAGGQWVDHYGVGVEVTPALREYLTARARERGIDG